jgi:hypothetical protein
MISHLLDYQHPETGGRDTLLFRKLLANPDYRARFLSALADQLNTTLASERVIAHIDRLAGELAPDIDYETLRWPGTTNWEDNVQELREFAVARPDHVREHVVIRFDLPGLLQLTVEPPLQGKGMIAINGHVPDSSAWHGVYFRGVPVVVTAVPAPGYVFVGWEDPDLPPTSEIVLEDREAQHIQAKFGEAGGNAPGPGDIEIVTVAVDETGDPEGDWFELRVTRRGGLDLRGWRITDNDTRDARDEGSLVLANDTRLEHVPFGTRIRIIATKTARNDRRYPADDVNAWDQPRVLYIGNDLIDAETDPWFDLGVTDNLAVLAPSTGQTSGTETGIAFWSSGDTVTPASFGILQDGVIQNDNVDDD